VRASTPRDAASLKTSHFEAVHHPLKLQQRSLDDRHGGKWVEESEIVRVLEGPLRPDGYLLLPIVGGSGTGKSHLVRWVWNRTKDRANWESRYLAKNRTSIRRVIEIVIEGLEGAAIEAAREALLSAPAQSESEQVLAERLLDELALITSEESVAHTDRSDRRAAEMAAMLRRDLPDVLRDPVVRRRLTGDGAVIPRLVGLALRGRRDGDGLDDDAIRVIDSDLPLEFAEIGEASKGARKLLQHLGAIPELRSAAVGRINDALPAAVKRVFVSGHVDLIEVFREVRREILASGKELVLFIEDLTVLHGVEREFLDAIVEPARSPDGDLCGLRVLFAVTEGHFDGLDTVRTRCDDAYRLDAVYRSDGVDQSDGVDHNEAISFLGRYLNACRHAPELVETLWADRIDEAWMPNACDVCEHQVRCHETFGRSEEGHGLYPYNAAAANRFVSSLSSERFDPRVLVRELVDRFLIVATADLERCEFPSDGLVGPFDERSEPVDPLLQSVLKSKRPGDFARVVNSIRYWSEHSTIVGDAILAAFGIDALGELDVSPTSQSRETDTPASSRASGRSQRTQGAAGELTLASRLSSAWLRIFDELDTWVGNQKDLSITTTNSLRKLVHKSVLKNLDFSALSINLGKEFDGQKRFDHQKHIRIIGSSTDQSVGDPIVVIERDADTAAALKGLILLEQLPHVDDYQNAEEYRRLAARCLEEWTDSVMVRLEQGPEPAIIEAVTGLLVCAAVSGSCEKASNPHDYLAALFGHCDSVADLQHRSREWQDVVETAFVTFRRLRPIVEAHFGEARGTGDVRAIRADQVLSIVRGFTQAWRLESTDPTIDRFMRSVKSAVEAEWETLELLAIGAAPLVDPSVSWLDQTERVLKLVRAANRLGRLPDHDAVIDLEVLASALGNTAQSCLLDAANLVARDPSFVERLQVVASSVPDIVAAISRFIARAERAMAGISSDLSERCTSESADETLEDVSSGVLVAVDRLADAVRELEQ
jgi:hypothetical protein